MKNLLTRKNILIVSILGSTLCAYLLYGVLTHLCYEQWGWCKNMWRPINDVVLPVLFFFPTMLVIQIATWRLNEQIIATWIKFLSWWVPLSIILIIVTPNTKGMFFPNLKEIFGLVLPGLFLLISLILIIKKSIQLRGE
jgi:hypothetical protein